MAPPDCPAGGYVADYLSFWAIWLAILAATWFFFRATRGRDGAARLLVGRALVFLAFAWTAVVAAETYLRYVYDKTDQYGLTMTNRAWFRRHVWLNKAGYRDREFVDEKPPGVERVAFLGDSFAFGWGIRNPDDAFPGLVRTALDARFPGRFQVRDYGEPGWATKDEADLLDKIAASHALDRVVIAYCLNDPDNFLRADQVFDREAAPRVPWIRPTWSFVADFLWFRLSLRNDRRVQGYFDWEKQAYDDPAIWGLQCAQFRRIAERCRATNIQLDVVVFPFFQLWKKDGGYEYDSCHERVAAAWKDLGVDVIDLRGAYRGIDGADLVVNRLDAHPNERAHQIAAQVILDRAFGVR